MINENLKDNNSIMRYAFKNNCLLPFNFTFLLYDATSDNLLISIYFYKQFFQNCFKCLVMLKIKLCKNFKKKSQILGSKIYQLFQYQF